MNPETDTTQNVKCMNTSSKLNVLLKAVASRYMFV